MIYFEEGLCRLLKALLTTGSLIGNTDCQALNLLTALLTSASASSVQIPVVLPPSQHLALIATLAVHPTLTTRAKTFDKVQASNLALQYLQLVLKHVGPLQSNLDEAFAFAGQGIQSRRGGRRRVTGEEASPVDGGFGRINNELANAGSLWARADNFWHVVGWCFNCSVLHKKRWERWSAWLSYMIDVLEADWEARELTRGNDTYTRSLILKYIDSARAASGGEKKIVRAIFADGRAKSVAEFGEIWKNETKELKKDADVHKAEKINIDADDYGDYMDDEAEADLEDSASDRSSPARDMNSYQVDSVPNTAGSLGGMESINLRVRLLSLLSKVSASQPDDFITLKNLYDMYLDQLRSIPIPAFFLIMSPPSLRPFVSAAASTLTQYVLLSLIAASAPLPPSDTLSQDILVNNYLPFPANRNTLVDNTKVSICIETLLRILDTHPEMGLTWTPELHEAAEAGIKARIAKAKKKPTKRGTDGDGGCDGVWLAASAERIRAVIAMARP